MSIEEYITYISDMKNNRKIPTGFPKLDNILGGGISTSSLTIIGAETGLGKTTFILQVADNLVKQENVKVLFISLELNKYELLSKTLSRISYQNDNLESHTPNEFIGNKVNNIESYFAEYEIIRDKVFLVDRIKDKNAIIDIVKTFRKKYADDNLVVVIDYLQYIKCDSNSDKQNIDNLTRDLKTMANENNLSIIAISSLSRSGSKNIDITSFKESGSIEYTADYLIVLKPKTTKDLAFETEGTTIIVEFLKNRFGEKKQFELSYIGNYATFVEN